jgi:gametolysin peptidase M11
MSMRLAWSPLAVAAAFIGLLALPHVASARPAAGPTLVRLSGQFVVVHADDPDGSSAQQPMLVDGRRRTPVHVPGDVWIEPGASVRLEGTMQDGTLVVADSLTAVRQLAPSPNSSRDVSAAPSTETTAVVLFYFQGQTPGSLPTLPGAASAAATMNTGATSLAGYYDEQTYGQVEFQADVYGPVQIAVPPPSSGDCIPGIFSWADQAEAALAGFDPSAYRHVVYAFPKLPSAVCGWSGLAEVGGSHVWVNGSFSVPVLAHELGHNLGLAHAGGLTCSAASATAPVGGACSIDRVDYALPQYADPFDAMGNAPVLRQMNMEHKLALGVLPPSAVLNVGTTGTYHLAPMETLGPAVELLRLAKPGGGTYFVEYRASMGTFDSGIAPGVLVHTESPDMSNPFSADYGDSDTALVDMHPDPGFSAGQWNNAAMSVGQTFEDAASGISIQVTAEDAAGATLAITAPRDTRPPSRPGTLSAVASGTSVALSWTPAGDDFGVASYSVARDGVAIGSTTGMGFSDSGLAPGATVAYAVTATDTSGNVGLPATVSVTLPDTTPPSAPAAVTASIGRDGLVRISWAAATDNVGVVAYRVLRDGTLVAQQVGTTYVDTTPRPGPGSTLTYSVVAVDVAGNIGPPGSARPLRAALLRPLGATRLKVVRARGRALVRVTGLLSDARAVCRLRIDRGAWHSCTVASGGAFHIKVRARHARKATLRLRDELGRVRQLALRVP